MRKAAKIIRQRKFEIAAIMSVEVGKNRMEAIGDAEESADLIDYYCDQMDDANGFIQEMNRITPIETNIDTLRPYGVFACIAPFNFPAALGFGMTNMALVAGNTMVFKPATDTPWTGLKITRSTEMLVYLPAYSATSPAAAVTSAIARTPPSCGRGRFHGLQGGWHADLPRHEPKLGQALSHGTWWEESQIIMDTADLDAATDGVWKSAWGLQNQKCSACSRVYVLRCGRGVHRTTACQDPRGHHWRPKQGRHLSRTGDRISRAHV